MYYRDDCAHVWNAKQTAIRNIEETHVEHEKMGAGQEEEGMSHGRVTPARKKACHRLPSLPPLCQGRPKKCERFLEI